MTPSVFIYVQHLMGIGHQRRMAAIARALGERGTRVTYVSGGLPLDGLNTGAAHFVQLNPCRCPDLNFDRLVLADGTPVDAAWQDERVEALLAAWSAHRHGLALVETYPFGRKLLGFELEPLTRAVKARGVPLVSSIRDIIDYRPKLKKYQRMAQLAKADFDAVLVHADPSFVPLEASFPVTADIAGLIHYTGYVDEGEQRDPTQARTTRRESGTAASKDVVADTTALAGTDAHAGIDEVVVSAGGGAYGVHLLRAALESRALSAHADTPWRVLVGENVAETTFRSIAADAPDGVVVERARQDFREVLARARVSISQGGYNTVLDVLQSGVRAVIVAYHDHTEREQLLRGKALAERGLIELLPDGELSPVSLAAAVDRAAQLRPAQAAINTRGASRSAELLDEWNRAGCVAGTLASPEPSDTSASVNS